MKEEGREKYGVGDDYVNASESLDRICDHPFTVRLNSLISLERKRLNLIFLTELLGELLSGLLGGLVVYSNIRALFGEFCADNGAEAAEGKC